jgi:hypothetical protein
MSGSSTPASNSESQSNWKTPHSCTAAGNPQYGAGKQVDTLGLCCCKNQIHVISHAAQFQVITTHIA